MKKLKSLLPPLRDDAGGGLHSRAAGGTLRGIRGWVGGTAMTQDTAGEHSGAAGLVDRVSESVTVKLLTKIVFPVVVLLLIPLIVSQWNGLTAKVGNVETGQQKQADKIAALGQEVTTINTKLDAGLIWRLTQLERRFDAMEARQERRDAEAPPRGR